MLKKESPFKSSRKPKPQAKPRKNLTLNPVAMQETLDTVSIDEELGTPRMNTDTKFLLICKICEKAYVKDTDESQILDCKHVYL